MAQLNAGVVIQGLSELGNWERFRRKGFFRNILVVMAGTAVSQVVSFGFSPILSRMFGPAEFGIFGTYIAVAGVLGVAATLNYTDALMLPAKDTDAAPLFLFACLATVMISLGTAIFCAAAPQEWLRVLGLADLGHYLWFLPPSVMLLGLGQCLTAWCARIQAFTENSHSQVVRSVTACATQTSAGLAGLGGAGLIGAAVIAEASTNVYLSRAVLQKSAPAFRAAARWLQLGRKANEYRDFAFYGCPQNVMNALSQSIPVIALAHFFGAAVAGSYAFGHRLLHAPLNLVTTAVRQVLFQKLSQLNSQENSLSDAFWKSTGALVALVLAPTLIGFAIAPPLFAFVFGEDWREAGNYARWLILWIGVVFCNVPANLALRVLRHQRDLFLFDLLHLLARTSILIVGGLWFGALKTIMCLGMIGAGFNFALILYAGAVVRSRSGLSTTRSPST